MRPISGLELRKQKSIAILKGEKHEPVADKTLVSGMCFLRHALINF